VIAAPLLAGATHDTVTRATPATTVGTAGALGTVLGTTAAETDEYKLVPTLFVAATLK
jgi:hypothetical protein